MCLNIDRLSFKEEALVDNLNGCLLPWVLLLVSEFNCILLSSILKFVVSTVNNHLTVTVTFLTELNEQ